MNNNTLEEWYIDIMFMINKEEKDIFTFFIKDSEVRSYICNKLQEKGLTTIDSVDHQQIYVDLKTDFI